MKRLFAILFTTVLCASALAAQTNVLQSTSQGRDKEAIRRAAKARTPRERAERHLAMMQRSALKDGGLVEKPGSQRGKIVIVNEQRIVSPQELKSAIEIIAIRDFLNVEFVDSASDKTDFTTVLSRKKELGANVIVLVSEDEKNPNMMLTAPEGCWAIVNASIVCKSATNDAFKKTRMVKMLQRAYYCACGAMNSQYPNSLMGVVQTPEELDRIPERAPVDVKSRTIDSLAKIGVTQKFYTTYLKACEEGWASAPTNDVQRAIWDKVHSIPDKPMKIEFDPATQKGKVTK